MPRPNTTPSFVAEFPLRVTRAQEKVVSRRFLAHGSLYNGVLGEALRRADAMRADPLWGLARTLPKGAKRSLEALARAAAFQAVATRYGSTPRGVEIQHESLGFQCDRPPCVWRVRATTL